MIGDEIVNGARRPPEDSSDVFGNEGGRSGHVEHEYPEGMFVTNGKVSVLVDGKAIAVSAGGMLIVPSHAVHTVMPASEGTLVIFN